jgi:hypothetical protein
MAFYTLKIIIYFHHFLIFFFDNVQIENKIDIYENLTLKFLRL